MDPGGTGGHSKTIRPPDAITIITNLRYLSFSLLNSGITSTNRRPIPPAALALLTDAAASLIDRFHDMVIFFIFLTPVVLRIDVSVTRVVKGKTREAIAFYFAPSSEQR